jgi:hypothetical protein
MLLLSPAENVSAPHTSLSLFGTIRSLFWPIGVTKTTVSEMAQLAKRVIEKAILRVHVSADVFANTVPPEANRQTAPRNTAPTALNLIDASYLRLSGL